MCVLAVSMWSPQDVVRGEDVHTHSAACGPRVLTLPMSWNDATLGDVGPSLAAMLRLTHQRGDGEESDDWVSQASWECIVRSHLTEAINVLCSFLITAIAEHAVVDRQQMHARMDAHTYTHTYTRTLSRPSSLDSSCLYSFSALADPVHVSVPHTAARQATHSSNLFRIFTFVFLLRFDAWPFCVCLAYLCLQASAEEEESD